MPVGYKIDILAALKAAGYSSTRIRNEKLMGIEVDLIATAPDGDVCFIEVKSRTTYSYGYALEAVTPAKIARYKRFINLYRLSTPSISIKNFLSIKCLSATAIAIFVPSGVSLSPP